MTINLHLPSQQSVLRPKITVVGVGGAGGNAVNNMINARLEGVEFVVANTDAQALDSAATDRRIQLGIGITRGLGAGADPQVGRAAAEEAIEDIVNFIEGSNMVFITAGMGGGTGTGAAPVVARAARELGILTVGVVTKPFQFEGAGRMRMAENGLKDLQQYVDTLIIIPNQNLFRLATEKTTFADAFRMADEVLHSGVRGVTDLMVKPGLVNLDFADIRTVMREMGKAMMGTGEATGEKRAIEAAEAAISNPLLDDVSLKGARAALINITGGSDMTLFEVDEAANRIREEVDPDANIIFGSTFSEEMNGLMRVSVVATGIDVESVSRGEGEESAARRAAAAKRPFSYLPGQTGNHSQAQQQRRPAPVSYTQAPSASRPVTSSVSVAARPQPQPQQHLQPQAQPQVHAQPESLKQSAALQPVAQPQPLLMPEEESFHYEQPLAMMEEPIAPRDDLFANVSPRDSRPLSQQKHSHPETAAAEVSQEVAPGFSFMNRIAEVKRAISAKSVEAPSAASSRSVQVTQTRKPMHGAEDAGYQMPSFLNDKPRPRAAEAGHDEEENLEIPAFLRRQAN